MKMKIPNEVSGNGYNGCNGSSTQYDTSAYHSDPSDTEEIDPPTLDGDFSEYMWMENEEEFDQQVLRQLEEEALMEQCIEAMLEDERESAMCGAGNGITQPSPNNRAPPAQQQAWSTADIVQNMDGLCISGDVVTRSNLNPNAVEFVPRNLGAAVTSSTG